MFGSGLLRDRRDMLRACHRVKHDDGHNSSLSNIEMDKPQAREIVYGMPYDEWKAKHQTEATEAQKQAFEANHKH